MLATTGSLVATTSPGAWGGLTAIAVAVTAATGILAWRSSERARKANIAITAIQEDQRRTSKSAEVMRAEHEGWATLMDHLREQYEAVVQERERLVKLLEATRTQLEATQAQLSHTQVELSKTRVELASMRERLSWLEIRLESRPADP